MNNQVGKHGKWMLYMEHGVIVGYKSTGNTYVDGVNKNGEDIRVRHSKDVQRLVTNTADVNEACAQIDRATVKPPKITEGDPGQLFIE